MGKSNAEIVCIGKGFLEQTAPFLCNLAMLFLPFTYLKCPGMEYGAEQLEQVLSIDKELEVWALEQAKYVLGDDKCFRYISTSDSNQISFSSVTSVQRKWDSRWVNTLIVWGITIWLLCKYRNKIIGLPREKAKSQNNA